MSDPVLGDLALRVLADILVGGLTGVGTFFALFRNAKKQIDDRAKEDKEAATKFHEREQERVNKLMDDVEQRGQEHLKRGEQQLGNRLALLDTKVNVLEGAISDGVHDLKEVVNTHAVQLGIHETMIANSVATLGRLETMVRDAATFKQNMLEQILTAVKAGKT